MASAATGDTAQERRSCRCTGAAGTWPAGRALPPLLDLAAAQRICELLACNNMALFILFRVILVIE